MTEIHQTVHDKLQRALHEFACSPRFVLFKDIQVGRLMPEECEGESVLHNLTFEALVSRSQKGTSEGQLCTPAQAESLLHLLAALIEDAKNTASSAHVGQIDPQRTTVQGSLTDVGGPPEQMPSIVQLEQDLQSSLARIKAHLQYERVAGKTLGQFWDPVWTPAPFEEMLTIRQLLSIDVAALFKKKTVTESRMANVCQALQRVVDVLEGMSSEYGLDQGKIPYKSAKKADFTEFCADPTSHCSLAGLAVYEALARGCHNQSEDEAALLAKSFLSQFSAEECIDVLLGRELTPTLLRRLSAIVKKTIEPMTLDLIQRLLEGPAVRIDYVTQVLSPSHVPPTAFMACVSTLVVRALGASEVQYQGKTYPGFWTLNPNVICDLLKARPSPSVRRRGRVYPRINQESLDPFLLELIQVQGRASVSRKGRPKGLKSRRRGGR